MGEAVEQGGRHLDIAEYLEMPHRLIGESLRSGWLTRLTRSTANVFPSVIDALGGASR